MSIPMDPYRPVALDLIKRFREQPPLPPQLRNVPKDIWWSTSPESSKNSDPEPQVPPLPTNPAEHVSLRAQVDALLKQENYLLNDINCTPDKTHATDSKSIDKEGSPSYLSARSTVEHAEPVLIEFEDKFEDDDLDQRVAHILSLANATLKSYTEPEQKQSGVEQLVRGADEGVGEDLLQRYLGNEEVISTAFAAAAEAPEHVITTSLNSTDVESLLGAALLPMRSHSPVSSLLEVEEEKRDNETMGVTSIDGAAPLSLYLSSSTEVTERVDRSIQVTEGIDSSSPHGAVVAEAVPQPQSQALPTPQSHILAPPPQVSPVEVQVAEAAKEMQRPVVDYEFVKDYLDDALVASYWHRLTELRKVLKSKGKKPAAR